MHGVGTEIITKVFAAAGFEPLLKVPEQAAPDADFPTVAFPNPEEPGALDLALALARERDADIIIANDPDADRCAVAVPFARRRGACCAATRWACCSRMPCCTRAFSGTYATTIVSSTMLQAMAERNRVGYAETLTGFKWISRAADDLVYGYEEALGYAVAPHLVRDKDGISAALLVAEYAAALKAHGSSLPQRLDELAAEYGRYATDQVSMRVDDLSIIDAAMARLRAAPAGHPARRAGHRRRPAARGRRRHGSRIAGGAGRGPAVGHRAEAQGVPGGRACHEGSAAEAADRLALLRGRDRGVARDLRHAPGGRSEGPLPPPQSRAFRALGGLKACPPKASLHRVRRIPAAKRLPCTVNS